jgi:hypothetical protein
MQTSIRYRGKTFGDQEIESIKKLIAKNPTLSRRRLSAKLCQQWNWVQANGALRDMVCRGLLLQLHRGGLIELPPKRCTPHNPLSQRAKPAVTVESNCQPITGPLAHLRPLEIRQVRRTPDETLFGSLIESHHYLGYTQPVGEHLKYLIYSNGAPIACMAWSSAPRHIGCRDRFIGWGQEVRRNNIHLLAYNTRFLILPFVHVPHLASHILGLMAKRISKDWQELYNHRIYFLETFIDPQRFRGTCYRAANWIYLGKTTGRGKDDQTGKPNRSVKEMWAYPLWPHFREQLGQIS